MRCFDPFASSDCKCQTTLSQFHVKDEQKEADLLGHISHFSLNRESKIKEVLFVLSMVCFLR